MSIEDVAICEKCGADLDIYSTDELEFGIGGEGHYYADCGCLFCGTTKRLCINFKYEITDCYFR